MRGKQFTPIHLDFLKQIFFILKKLLLALVFLCALFGYYQSQTNRGQERLLTLIAPLNVNVSTEFVFLFSIIEFYLQSMKEEGVNG